MGGYRAAQRVAKVHQGVLRRLYAAALPALFGLLQGGGQPGALRFQRGEQGVVQQGGRDQPLAAQVADEQPLEAELWGGH